MPQLTSCPDLNTLKRLVADQLDDAEGEGLHEHLLRCKTCSQIVQRLRRSAAVPADAAATIPPGAGLASHRPGPSAAPESSRSEAYTGTAGEFGSSDTPVSAFEDCSFLAPPVHPGDLGRLGNYRILKMLGEGGMGMVFLAKDLMLERDAALKVMKPDKSSTDVSRKRFLLEAKAAASLQHDHIVTIYQVNEDRGVLYMAMQFLSGEPLDTRLKREGRLPVADVLRLGRQTAEGLAAAHERGLVHRDIKPANIWLEQIPSGPPRVKILDFGLARSVVDDTQNLTKTGVIVGTPSYMAPEQARGLPVDYRCDLFSLGCVLYHMCAGRPPFLGDDVMATLTALAVEDPVPLKEQNPDVPQFLDDLIMRLLAKDPEARPQPTKVVAETMATAEMTLSRASIRVPSSGNIRLSNPRSPGVAAEAPRPPSPRSSSFRTIPPVSDDPDPGHEPDGLVATNSLADVDGIDGSAVPASAPATPPEVTPRKKATKALAEEIGLCPRCGAMRRKSAIQGWCMACGYHPQLEETHPPPQVNKGVPAWAYVLVGGLLLLVVANVIGNAALPKRNSIHRAWWGVLELAIGALLYIAANIWGLIYTIKSGEKVGFLSPLRMWKIVAEYLPQSQYALYMVSWGTTAVLLAVTVMGGQWYWVDRMKPRKGKKFGPGIVTYAASADRSPEEMDEDMAGMIAVTETPEELEIQDGDRDLDEEPLKRFTESFRIAGYMQDDDGTISDLVIGQPDGGNLRYAGIVSAGVTDDVKVKVDELPKGTKPATFPLVVGAVWVEPSEWCLVEFTKVNEFGIAEDPLFKGLDKPVGR